MSSTYFNALIGTEINGTYRIEEKLAVGGMGAVFRATHLAQGTSVAIKVISPQLATNPVFVKRFQREARVGFTLSHPNIVKVLELGETEKGLLFMVMEFVPGETLAEYLEKSSPLSVSDCIEILQPLCDALDTAHLNNILHRDIKPANILIEKNGEKHTNVKIVDFGLVKLLEPNSDITEGSNLTVVGEAFGTPFYMPPEQIMGQVVLATADIYSLGVILYQMLTGKMPIEGTNIREILTIKVTQDVAPPSGRFYFIPQEIDPVIQKVLARDPLKRYQTAGEFFQAFRQASLSPHTPIETPIAIKTDEETAAVAVKEVEQKQEVDLNFTAYKELTSPRFPLLWIVVVIVVILILVVVGIKFSR